jgi:hypothetical protein
MKRREFLQFGVMGSVAVLALKSLGLESASAAEAKIGAKNIMKDGMPATIANYCEHPEKQPNKACPGAKEKPGNCTSCMFFNKDNSLTTFKGKKYAHCQLLSDATKPQFVSENGWCATYTKKP